MTNLRRLFSASLTAAVIVLGLALTASPARADIITFVVDEGAVPGANDQNVTPDPNDITGKYQELLILDTSTGKFQAFLVVNFTGYVLDGVPVPSQIGAPVSGGETDNTNLYGLYALVTASGDFTSTPIGSGNTLLQFEPDASTADIWTDPLRDTTKDYTTASTTGGTSDDQHVMTASLLDEDLSFGTVVLNSSNVVLTGSYALVYTNPDVLLDEYWPTLALLTLKATASGDVDTAGQGSVFPTNIHGDTDITFEEVRAVPEPASLLLLGGGLLGLAARRRRAAKK